MCSQYCSKMWNIELERNDLYTDHIEFKAWQILTNMINIYMLLFTLKSKYSCMDTFSWTAFYIRVIPDPKVSQFPHFLYAVCEIFDMFLCTMTIEDIFVRFPIHQKPSRTFLEDSRCSESMLIRIKSLTKLHDTLPLEQETKHIWTSNIDNFEPLCRKIFRNVSPEFL